MGSRRISGGGDMISRWLQVAGSGHQTEWKLGSWVIGAIAQFRALDGSISLLASFSREKIRHQLIHLKVISVCLKWSLANCDTAQPLPPGLPIPVNKPLLALGPVLFVYMLCYCLWVVVAEWSYSTALATWKSLKGKDLDPQGCLPLQMPVTGFVLLTNWSHGGNSCGQPL